MHGVKKFEITPEYLDLQKKKIEKYNFLKSELFKLKKKKEFQGEKLDVLGKLLFISPDFTTLWNYRREILLNLDLVKNEANLENELNLTYKIFKERDIKSYGTWHHRLWIINNFYKTNKVVLERELINTAKVLSEDLRNFHCWNYRKEIIQLLGKDFLEKEIKFLNSLFAKNPSNYSAWHNKALYLKTKEEYENEFKLCLNLFYTDPEDSSSWIFHRFLLEKNPELLSSPYCYDLLEILEEKEMKWTILTIVLNSEKKFHFLKSEKEKTSFKSEKSEEIFKFLDILVKIDPFRRNYYLDKRSDFLLNFNLIPISTKFLFKNQGLTRFDSVIHAPNLKVLNLENNKIRYIPDFSKESISSSLEEINLNKNEIEYIYNIKCLKKLRILRLEENRIGKINKDVILSNVVEEVYLKGNMIEKKVFLIELVETKTLDLDFIQISGKRKDYLFLAPITRKDKIIKCHNKIQKKTDLTFEMSQILISGRKIIFISYILVSCLIFMLMIYLNTSYKKEENPMSYAAEHLVIPWYDSFISENQILPVFSEEIKLKEKSKLLEKLYQKYESFRSGEYKPFRAIIIPSVGGFGNNLRGLLSAILITLFTDSIVLIHSGVGDYHVGNILDYFAVRHQELHHLMRYENHKMDRKWIVGMSHLKNRPTTKELNYTQREYTDMITQANVKMSKIKIIDEFDGENCHYCQSKACKFLQNEEINGKLETVFPISKNEDTSIVYRINNLYSYHILKSKKKMEILCGEYNLCDGIENYRKYVNYVNFPKIGYQYLGSKLSGNLFNEIFELHPRLLQRFNDFYENNVKGPLIGLQVRAAWMNNPSNSLHKCPKWEKFVECLKDVIIERNLSEMTVFISSDSKIPERVINEIENVGKENGNSIRVITKDDYLFDKSLTNELFQFAVNTEEGVISTVFDFKMLAMSDISITNFISSFGQISTSLSNSFPPYQLFHKDYALGGYVSPEKCLRTRIFSFWMDRWKELKPYKDWVFEFNM